MNKNLLWKALLITALVVFAVLLVYPPEDNLKPGLDLAGGTSLIYDIDVSDLDAKDAKGIAQRMIPILLRRVDPTNVANIVMRPLGDKRIEIQLPLASAETRKKRVTYEDALRGLDEGNVNLLIVKRALFADADKRDEIFAEFAGDFEARKTILDELIQSHQDYKVKRDKRDALAAEMETAKEQLASAGLSGEYVEAMASQWVELDESSRKKTIDKYVDDNKPEGLLEGLVDILTNNAGIVNKYVDAYAGWSDVVNEIAEPETGVAARFADAEKNLMELNLSMGQVEDILNLPSKSAQRREYLASLRERFPQREEKIDEVVQAYSDYKSVGGRLDDPQDLKRMLKGAGVLEFRVLPTPEDGIITASQIEGYKEALQRVGPRQATDSKYVWVEVEKPSEWNAGGTVTGVFGEKLYVLASNQAGEVMLPGQGDKQWKLKRAYPTSDQMGRQAIGFTHDEIAARLFYTVTKNNLERPLCILLDGIAISAPNVQSAIRSSGIITGSFTPDAIDDMVNKLNAGSFPARLSEVPVSEKSIGPMIGADNRDKGIKAGKYGLVIVAVFMLIYYIKCGGIADIALLMNMLFVLGMMAMFGATFTLPGIAGLILTIGMSVDANVLIFERIREEQDRGSSLRMAIQNGYQRAFRTIFDANVTTFITALILYMVASEEIKGFAIVLMLGIISSMFTALFVTRVVFNFLLEKRIIRDHLVMLRLIHKPDINWMGMCRVFFTVSVVLIATGMFVFFSRDNVKNNKYDIEFTGGTSVQINLKDGTSYDRAKVQQEIQQAGLDINNPALAAAKVYTIGDDNLQYEISTTATNKTSATVSFTQPGQTVETVTVAIEDAAKKSDGTLYNLVVTAKAGSEFEVSTSQVNKSLVREVLNAAFDEGASVSAPVVNEVVSKAVRETFAGLLAVNENLGVNVNSVEKVDEVTVELAEFLGGVRISCSLEKEVTWAKLDERFRAIRFKPDTRDLKWDSRSRILSDDLVEFTSDDVVKSFVYASVHPEAGFRQLNEQEWQRFVTNETTKIEKAAALETTLARVTQIDPSIGKQAKTRGLIAIVMSLIAIVGYIWIRFGTARYGFAAIIALVHDVCITLGAVTACTYIAGTPLGKALLIGDFKINLQMIAALLTIIGYSLNDTIVVFDRIRENRGKLSDLNPQIISNSINQTLSRTLLTSFTTFIVVLVMYIFGGAGLRGFTFAMLIGILVGTYSSVAIAAPILLLGKKAKAKK
jgi:SecD/SecF fusion protein